jgi:hypothetical protein
MDLDLPQRDPRQSDLDLSRRMDNQDALLREIKDTLIHHIAKDEERQDIDGPVAKALDEIVLLWRASKVVIPVAVAVAVGLWAFVSWWKEHIKWD